MSYYMLSIYLDEPSMDYTESSSITVINVNVKACLEWVFKIIKPEIKIDHACLSLMAQAGGRISCQNIWNFDAMEFGQYIKENFYG